MCKEHSVWWHELSWPEVEKKVQTCDTVLLPLGSTEQHGRHLPLGVDVFIPIEIAERVSARTQVPILPPVWYAPCAWHMNFPGTISISSNTLISLVVDICTSLQEVGIKHIIGINGHTSGSDPALQVAADMILEKTGARFWLASVVDVAHDKIFDICEYSVLGHADEIETSKMMAIRPELVHIKDVIPNNNQGENPLLSVNLRPSAAWMYYRMNKDDWASIAPEGYSGDPSAASPEKGNQMLNSVVENIESFIEYLRNWQGVMT
jgi:creatinine amidohydrolase